MVQCERGDKQSVASDHCMHWNFHPSLLAWDEDKSGNSSLPEEMSVSLSVPRATKYYGTENSICITFISVSVSDFG